MSRFTFRTAALAALAFGIASTSAAAQSSPNASGHYEWRPAPQFGPRAAGGAPRRVWVPDKPHAAECDCDMMRSHPADCMRGMSGRSNRHSAN